MKRLRKLLRRALDDPAYSGVPQAMGELDHLIAAGSELAEISTLVGRELGVSSHADLHSRLASALALWEESAGVAQPEEET